MNFSIELQYPAAAETVMKMVVDKRYFERKYQALEVADFTITQHQVSDQTFGIDFRFRAAGATNIPEFAKKFVGDAIRVKQAERWQIAQRKGTIDIDIAGAPVSVHADMQLFAKDANRSMLRLDWTIRCGVPLLGGKVEKLIAEDVRRRAEADGAISAKLVSEYA
jgi:hypothetical protein